MRRASLLLLATIAGSIGTGAVSFATSEAAHSADVSATFEFAGQFPHFERLRLKITRDRSVVYDERVTSATCASDCAPAVDPPASSVRVLDLENDGQPDVVLSLSVNGGARCCLVDQVFSFDPAATTYVEAEHNFTDSGAGVRIVDVAHDGRYEFVSSDPAFFGAFANLADSAEPVQVWTFRALRFSDVTCRYPGLITADAETWLRDFKRYPADGEGYIAAWAADEDRLGRSGQVRKLLTTELRRHRLRGSGIRAGKAFVDDLSRFLSKHGYIHACATQPYSL